MILIVLAVISNIIVHGFTYDQLIHVTLFLADWGCGCPQLQVGVIA